MEVSERAAGLVPVAAATRGLRQLAFISSQCWRSESDVSLARIKSSGSRECPSINPGVESFLF